MQRFISLFAICLLIGSTSTLLAQPAGFDTWDKDGDNLIERYEFTETFVDRYYSAWEASDEAGLVEEGFFQKTYAGLDTDNDNMLSDEEWLVGYNYFYDDYLVYEDLGFVDMDGDGYIDYEEYYDVMYSTDYFTDIDMDADNYISEYELADYVFDNWDFDDSGTISPFEYKRFERYYIDV